LTKTRRPAFQEKMAKDRLTCDDFLTQRRSVRKMGSFKDLLGMVPGWPA